MDQQVQKQIAETILQQLGGNRFIAMTGAKDFMALSEGGLRFRVPKSLTKNKASIVQVKLTADDLYEISFYDFRKLIPIPKGITVGVFAEDLRRTFTAHSGLDCTL